MRDVVREDCLLNPIGHAGQGRKIASQDTGVKRLRRALLLGCLRKRFSITPARINHVVSLLCGGAFRRRALVVLGQAIIATGLGAVPHPLSKRAIKRHIVLDVLSLGDVAERILCFLSGHDLLAGFLGVRLAEAEEPENPEQQLECDCHLGRVRLRSGRGLRCGRGHARGLEVREVAGNRRAHAMCRHVHTCLFRILRGLQRDRRNRGAHGGDGLAAHDFRRDPTAAGRDA